MVYGIYNILLYMMYILYFIEHGIGCLGDSVGPVATLRDPGGPGVAIGDPGGSFGDIYLYICTYPYIYISIFIY